jgi:hypothetical protein
LDLNNTVAAALALYIAASAASKKERERDCTTATTPVSQGEARQRLPIFPRSAVRTLAGQTFCAYAFRF